MKAIFRAAFLAVPASALLLPHTAFAQQRDRAGEHDDNRWYIVAQQSDASFAATLESDASWWGRIDDDSNTHGLGVGYNILPSLGVRATYEWARSTEAGNVCPSGAICPAVAFTEDTDTDALSLVAVPRWQIGSGWEVFGTAGVLAWRSDPDGMIGRDRDVDVLAGVGVGYEFPLGLALAVEYQETVFSPDLDYDAVRLSLSYGLGR